jgi:hypothetical protein
MSDDLTLILPAPINGALATILTGGELTLYVHEYVLLETRPTGPVADLWRQEGRALDEWPNEPTFIPRALSKPGVTGKIHVVHFGRDEIERLRFDLLAFSRRRFATESRRRSLDNPKHLLAFINTWGMVTARTFPVGTLLLCERVSAVRELLRPFVDAASGSSDDVVQAVATTKLTAVGSYVAADAVIRRVGPQGFRVELRAVTLHDVLSLLVAEWAGSPFHPCENRRCRNVAPPRQRFCSDRCGNAVYQQVWRLREKLKKGVPASAIAERYGLTAVEIQDPRAKLKEANARPRKRRGARR